MYRPYIPCIADKLKKKQKEYMYRIYIPCIADKLKKKQEEYIV